MTTSLNIATSKPQFVLTLIKFMGDLCKRKNNSILIGESYNLFKNEKVIIYKEKTLLTPKNFLGANSLSVIFNHILLEDEFATNPIYLLFVNFLIKKKFIYDLNPNMCFSDYETDGILEELKNWKITFQNGKSETFYLDWFDNQSFLKDIEEAFTVFYEKELANTSLASNHLNFLLSSSEIIQQEIRSAIIMSIPNQKISIDFSFRYFKF